MSDNFLAVRNVSRTSVEGKVQITKSVRGYLSLVRQKHVFLVVCVLAA